MTTTEFPWDQFASSSSEGRIKFEQPGQSVVGVITQIGVTDFGTGKPEDRTPELHITTDDGQEVTLAASQTRLRSALAEQRPQVGDKIAIVFTGYGEAKPPKSPPKLFDVKVVRNGANGNGQPAAEQQAPAPVAQPAAGGPSAADLI